MSMEHKAFKFDYEGFMQDLAPILYEALRTDDVQQLVEYIESHRERLTDPYEGDPLDASWMDLVETKDAHQLGDFALTAFYSPKHNVGLGYEWEHPREVLNAAVGDGDRFILGKPFGPPHNEFDAGKMGTFFQSPSEVESNKETVATLSTESPDLADALVPVENMFTQAERSRSGLYVTF